jgi:hypothetical protein
MNLWGNGWQQCGVLAEGSQPAAAGSASGTTSLAPRAAVDMSVVKSTSVGKTGAVTK